MQFSAIRVVLVATSHPGNIGASARALKTMGFKRLYLVAPKFFPDSRATEMSAGADDILESAVVVNTLQEALTDCQLVIGTSARPRGLNLPGFRPDTCANFIHAQAENTEVALVFGSERSGLTNEELLACNYHLIIPSNPDYSSLNLSQAVQIVLYELRKKLDDTELDSGASLESLATFDEVENLFKHMEIVLESINFLKLKNPGKVMPRIRRMFNRIKLEQMEVSILRGIMSHIQKSLSN